MKENAGNSIRWHQQNSFTYGYKGGGEFSFSYLINFLEDYQDIESWKTIAAFKENLQMFSFESKKKKKNTKQNKKTTSKNESINMSWGSHGHSVGNNEG